MVCGYLLVAMGLAASESTAQSQPPPQATGLPAKQADHPAIAANSDTSKGDSDNSSPAASEDDSVPADYDNSLGMPFLKHVVLDQKQIWTSPARIHLEDASWLIPFGGFAAGLMATDRDVSFHLSTNTSTLNRFDNISNYGLYAMIGGAGGLYLLGRVTHDEHKRETGLLAGEAALNSLAVVTAVSYATGRERPLDGNHSGSFWSGGASFPSDHAAISWSIASVVAHEYPSPWMKLLAYGAATAISVSRVYGRQHFPSDVLVGTGVGWLVGQQVYVSHHDPDLGGASWGSWSDLLVGDRPYTPSEMGSPYVPIDSWVYASFDRLAALGYLKSDISGLRPWTRMECARLLQEAQDGLRVEGPDSKEAGAIYDTLAKEFANETKLLSGGENLQIQLESVYARGTDVSGQPLRDGFDFGQTIVNDYGRPYAEGFNSIVGFTSYATAGPLVGYVRGEYQGAPSAPSLPGPALNAIAQMQGIPVAPTTSATGAVNRFDALEAYGGLQLGGWQITFGKQEQWWGADDSGAILFSNNAEPIMMFQINRVSPYTLPGFLRHVGLIRTDFILGRLGGQNWVYDYPNFVGSWEQPLSDQPFIVGSKITFKPTPNLEFGMGITTLFAGQGVPFTLHKFGQALFSLGNGLPGSSSDPGDRRGGFDFKYRIPGLRNWLTMYADTFTDDEISPWRRWDKAAVISGIYMPRIPKIPKLDFRAEGIYTDPPTFPPTLEPGFFYWNDRFRNGYTNDKNLIGNWIGRQGQGAEAWSTYWFNGRDKLQFTYRHEKVSKQLVPGGGTLTDAGVNGQFWWRSTLSVSAALQYETWTFPVIAATQQSDITSSVTLTFWPHFGRSSAGEGASKRN